MASLRVGFVGTGGWGRQLANRVAFSDKMEIAACFDAVPESREEFASEYGGRPCGSLEELLDTPGIDAVFNATANAAHADVTVRAAARGLHVFVEKPIANKVVDGLRMIEACENAGVVLLVGHCHRRHAQFRKMREMISEGRIGRPLMVEANNSHGGGRSMSADHWRCNRDTCPATPMMQLGIHSIDTMHYLLGDSTAASGMLAHVEAKVEIDDVTMGLVEFESGARGYIGSCYVIQSVNYLHVYGSEGNLCSYDANDRVYFRDFSMREAAEILLDPVDQVREEVEEFADCCLGRRQPETGGIEGLKALAVVETIIASAHTGGGFLPIDTGEVR